MASSQHQQDPRAVIRDVQPVPNVAAVPIDREGTTVESVQDHQRNELFWKLKRPVIVGRPGDHHGDAIRREVGKRQHRRLQVGPDAVPAAVEIGAEMRRIWNAGLP